MKRLRLMVILTVLVLTGCGKDKKIECAYYEQNENLKTTYNYDLKFDANKKNLKNLEITIEVTANSKEILEEFITTNNVCNEFIESKGLTENDYIKCQSKEEDKKLLVTVTYDYSKLTKLEKSKLFGSLTFDDAQKNYENDAYDKNTCIFDSNEKIDPVLKRGGAIGNLSTVQKNAAIDTTNSLIMAAEGYIASYMLENAGAWNGDITFVCDETGCFANVDGNNVKLDYRGMVPTSGELYLTESGEVKIQKELIINGYTCNMDKNGNINCEK